ncbi:MAG TPA: helix-turn-helix domain-containing protein [Acidimicrobiales bacterium]|jgi:transcriptional regulator with XRE-family HTH domain
MTTTTTRGPGGAYDRLTMLIPRDQRPAMGDRLMAARYQADLSTSEVAAEVGVSVNAVSQWEQGAVPRPEFRARLARLYRTDETSLWPELDAARAQLPAPRQYAKPSGNRLAAGRTEAGLTLQAVADRLGVSNSVVAAWERGSVPDDDRRAALADLYGIGEAVLFAEYESALAAVRRRWPAAGAARQRIMALRAVDTLSNRRHSGDVSGPAHGWEPSQPGAVDRRPHLYTVAQVAAELGVARARVYQLVRAGRLTRVPHIRRTFVTGDSLHTHLAHPDRRSKAPLAGSSEDVLHGRGRGPLQLWPHLGVDVGGDGQPGVAEGG